MHKSESSGGIIEFAECGVSRQGIVSKVASILGSAVAGR